MVRKLLSFFICFYAILFIFGIEKAYGDVDDHSLYEKIYKHEPELLNICQDLFGMMDALKRSGEFGVVQSMGTSCTESLGHVQVSLTFFQIYYLVYNNEDRSRISPVMNNYLKNIINSMETHGRYINNLMTISHNNNVVLTGGRLKNKIAEINEDMKKIRFK